MLDMIIVSVIEVMVFTVVDKVNHLSIIWYLFSCLEWNVQIISFQVANKKRKSKKGKKLAKKNNEAVERWNSAEPGFVIIIIYSQPETSSVKQSENDVSNEEEDVKEVEEMNEVEEDDGIAYIDDEEEEILALLQGLCISADTLSHHSISERVESSLSV